MGPPKYKLDEEGRTIEISPTGEERVVTLTEEQRLALVRQASSTGPQFVQPREYSSLLAEEFCYHISSGKTVHQSCKASGLSYHEYLRWYTLYDRFKVLVEEAKKNRAEEVFERLLDVAENTAADQDEVALGRLKADIYKHVAAVTDDKFVATQRMKAEHKIGVVSLETGIRRPGDAGYEETEIFRELDQKQLLEKGKKE